MGLCTGALLGKLEGAHLPGALRDRWRTPLLGTLKDMLSKALEMGVFIHRGSQCLGTWKGCSFPRDFNRRVRFLLENLGET